MRNKDNYSVWEQHWDVVGGLLALSIFFKYFIPFFLTLEWQHILIIYQILERKHNNVQQKQTEQAMGLQDTIACFYNINISGMW